MFTDWTMTDPTYFYFRGAVWGFVMATILWKIVVPWILERKSNG